MLRFLPLLALIAVVAFTGCRETVVGPAPILIDPEPAAPTLPSLYVKGPASLRLNAQGAYRAEPLVGLEVARYRWGFYGDGALSAVSDDPEGLDRLIQGQALRAGAITLYVHAYDTDGNTLAYGSKEVEITPY